MNSEKYEVFAKTYRAKLLEAVQENPGAYYLNGMTPGQYATRTADLILVEMQKNFNDVSILGEGFKRTCKALGIKHTRKAIMEFIEV